MHTEFEAGSELPFPPSINALCRENQWGGDLMKGGRGLGNRVIIYLRKTLPSSSPLLHHEEELMDKPK